MTDIRHIVFDIGQVLVHYDPTLPFLRILPDEERRAFFFAHVCTSAWNAEQDRGRTWAEAEHEKIRDYPEWENEILAFRLHWEEMVPHAYEDSVAILERLVAEGRDVTLLTNFAADTYVVAEAIYPFLRKGRGVTVSGRVHMIKPDPAIYALHTETFGLEPSATLFIDDSARNVEAANAFGWNAVQFTGADALKADLKRFGL